MSADEPAPTSRPLDVQLAELHPACWGWALACCHGDRVLAEEVLHVSYHKVLSGRAVFAGRSPFKTWLFGVIRLTALDERRWNIRRWLRFAPWSADSDQRADETAGGADRAQRHERHETLRAALSGLAARQAEVLHLVFYQDLTLDEAAVAMGVSPGTARTHYERGKAALRRHLGATEERP